MIKVDGNVTEIEGIGMDIMAEYCVMSEAIFLTLGEDIFAMMVKTMITEGEGADEDTKDFIQGFRRIILALQIDNAIKEKEEVE